MPSSSSPISPLNSFGGTSALALSSEERKSLGIQGLLPPAVQSRSLQMLRSLRHLDSIEHPLHKYMFLQRLHISDPDLFFSLLVKHTVKMLPLVYTPSVGLACQKWSELYFAPQGLYIPVTTAGHVIEHVNKWPTQQVDAIVFSDGGRILGLGDLGANGMGISIGKLALYVACAGLHPSRVLPVILDCGTDNQELLGDELYIGLRQRRSVTSTEVYDAFVREFMDAVVTRFGRYTLLQFEDFGTNNALRLLEQNRNHFTTFNDDIQGTAAMTLAGLLAALPLLESHEMHEQTIVFLGAGSAGIGIASMIAAAMAKTGKLSLEEARKRVWAVDSRGLIVKDRPKGGMAPHKLPFAHEHEPIDSFADVIASIKPTMLVGVSSQPKAFSREVLQIMAKNHQRPVVFALSNPTSKSECSAEDAYTFTEGRALFASGSPFPKFEMDGKTFEPGQANNVYVFPGVGLGARISRAKHITDAMLMSASQALASMVTDEDRARGSLYPALQDIRQISSYIAYAVASEAFDSGVATVERPSNLEATIQNSMYDPLASSHSRQVSSSDNSSSRL